MPNPLTPPPRAKLLDVRGNHWDMHGCSVRPLVKQSQLMHGAPVMTVHSQRQQNLYGGIGHVSLGFTQAPFGLAFSMTPEDAEQMALQLQAAAAMARAVNIATGFKGV